MIFPVFQITIFKKEAQFDIKCRIVTKWLYILLSTSIFSLLLLKGQKKGKIPKNFFFTFYDGNMPIVQASLQCQILVQVLRRSNECKNKTGKYINISIYDDKKDETERD